MATNDLKTKRAATREKTTSKSTVQLKTPNGTRDWVCADIAIRDQTFSALGQASKRDGGMPRNTSLFELK